MSPIVSPLKTFAFTTSILLWALMPCCSDAQATASPVIEGGKLVVELIKVIGAKKETTHGTGCKDAYADLCIENQSAGSISVSFRHRISNEAREVVVLPAGKECSLQMGVGVWTYDLKIPGNNISIRKGDLMVEGCNNLTMNIK
jgi:hypothetical protein